MEVEEHVETHEARFKSVMGRFPTGVTVVAARDRDGEPCGLTVSSFASVSLVPPLVLVCIDRAATSHDRIVEAGGFGISILASTQTAVAERFAVEPAEGRFDDVAWNPSETGHPIIEGAAAWIDCEIHEVVPGGDHSILIGRAVAEGVGGANSMVYHRGAFGSAGP
jgi:flavin reductase (DIM6/NTAB) family NADH-FMN oxidoreductase RutF